MVKVPASVTKPELLLFVGVALHSAVVSVFLSVELSCGFSMSLSGVSIISSFLSGAGESLSLSDLVISEVSVSAYL